MTDPSPPTPREASLALGRQIAARHGVPFDRVNGQCKSPRIVAARQEFWVALLDRGFSLSQAGRATGGHHHTTVLHGRRAHARRVGVA